MEVVGKIPDISQMVAGKNPDDRYRRRLLELTQGPGAKSLEFLSEHVLGKAKGYLRDFVTKGSPRQLNGDMRLKLANYLGVAESELGNPPQSARDFTAAQTSREIVATPNAIVQPLHRDSPVHPTGDLDLPILGHAKGGEDDAFFIDNGEIAGYTMRPNILKGVADAYAVIFHDRSMEPALKHGHTGWVHPRRPVKPGDDVVVQLNDGQALVKELVRRTDKDVVLKQHNPPKELKIKRAEVKSIHLIVMAGRVVT